MANYTSPTWVNNQAPKLNATNLQALTDTVEASQILRGNGAPTSSTEGTVGQKYVDESTAPNTIYVCTEVSGQNYTWEKAATRIEIDEIKEDVDIASEAALSAYHTGSASGAFVSFTDGGDNVPVKDLTVNINPVQDLHGYDHPWPGGGGKNLLPTMQTQASHGATITVAADGSIRASGTADSQTSFGGPQFTLAPGDYILSGAPSGSSSGVYDI